MLIEFNKLQNYNITPYGVIHVGMHTAEEYSIYKNHHVEKIIFIEANARLASEGIIRFVFDENVEVIHSAISDRVEEVEFTITNNGESSSILPLGDHSSIYPFIFPIESVNMETETLDQALSHIDFNDYNILNLDIQGAELKALKGFSKWNHIDAIFTEVNFREMYKGCAMCEEIEDFLWEKGFIMVLMEDAYVGWGDALFIKKDKL